MFLGGSLSPEYYTSKVNLMVALGPVASTKNLEVPALQKLAKVWREVQLIVLEAGMHDLFDSNWW